MAKHSSSRRLEKLVDQIEDTEFLWSPSFATRPDETPPRSLPFHVIIEDINEWLSNDEMLRYATEPSGSDYFKRAWNSTEEFNKTRSYFQLEPHEQQLTDKFFSALIQDQYDESKNGIAEAEHYLDRFRHALQYQYECAQAARAYVQTIGKEHHNELLPFVPFDPKNLEEALDLHLIDVGKYDPLLKHHIHAAFNSAVHVEGATPYDVIDATFDATKFDGYFAKLEKHLRTNINTLGDMIKGLSRYRERIEEASHSPPQRQR